MAQSSVHTVLRIREIFDLILEHVAEENGATNKRIEIPIAKTLMLLALVCKEFRDPALALLWRSLDSLQPLLRLLPGFRKIDDLWFLSGCLELHDCPRFHFYRCCIKRLHWYDQPSDRYHVAVPLRLATIPGGLFPHLRDLTMESDFDTVAGIQHTISFVPALLAAPTLISWRVIIRSSIPDAAVSGTPPNWCTEIAAMFAVSSAYLVHFHHLQLLSLDIQDGLFSINTVHALSVLPRLRILKLSGFQDNENKQWTGWTTRHQSALPALEKLYTVLPLSQTAKILQWISSPCLAVVKLHLRGSVKMSDRAELWETCLKGLLQSQSTLKSLSIFSRVYDFIPFRDFLGFPQLDTLAAPLNFIESDIPEMAVGWNKVRTLLLEGHARMPMPGRTLPSIQSLKWFQLHCPNLRYLSITVADNSQTSAENNTAIPEDAEMASIRVVDHGLKVLELNNSQFSDPFSVIRDLNMMFPNMVQVRAMDDALSQTLQKGLADFRAIREHERTRVFLRL